MFIRDVKPGQKFRMHPTKEEFLKIERVQVLINDHPDIKNVVRLHPESQGKLGYLPEDLPIETILFP